MAVIDLRSDFLTRPSIEMIDAMAEAARTPAAFGLREDGFVQRLEREAAQLLGQEDALFCPTCTQANQIAINVHCRAGDRVVAESESHIFTSEAAALAALSGVMPRPVPGTLGVMDMTRLETALQPGDALRGSVGLLVLENTHVRSGGCVLPQSDLVAQAAAAHGAGVPVHLDGARLANAAIAQGTSIRDLTAPVDSVSLSLNKGLGAPLGAVLAGSRPFVERAERVRQRFGGGWRPAGIPAAAAWVALRSWRDRLTADHARARRLALAISRVAGVLVELDQVQTNLVLAGVTGVSASALLERLAGEDILAIATSADTVRLALYHDIDDDAVNRVIAAFGRIAAERQPG